MLFIFISALCSVAVSILLKHSVRRGFDAGQLIGWNYLAAAGLCAGILQPNVSALANEQLPWAALLGLSIVLPGIFLALSRSLAVAGIIKTEVAQRMSLLLSLAAAFIWFGEALTWLKLVGLGLGVIAVLGLVLRPDNSPVSGSRAPAIWPILLTVWVGYAAVDVLLKEIARAGVPFTLSLLVSFSLAFVGVMIWQVVRHIQGRRRLTFSHCLLGLLLGLLNFSNIGFYIVAHQRLAEQPAVVFAMMNLLVVLLGTVAGMLFFREKLSNRNWAAVVLAVAAILILAASRF